MQEIYFENEVTQLFIRDGIAFCVYKPNAVVMLKIAEEIVQKRLEMTNNKIFPLFADLRQLKYYTKEARAYMGKEGSQLASGGVLVINSTIHRIIGNYFIKFDRPQIPVRLFTDEQKALEWLQQFKTQSVL